MDQITCQNHKKNQFSFTEDDGVKTARFEHVQQHQISQIVDDFSSRDSLDDIDLSKINSDEANFMSKTCNYPIDLTCLTDLSGSLDQP